MSSIEKIAFLAKLAAARPGLWANIQAKKKRGESAAKPGDEDYPDSKNWSKVTAISEKKVEKQALASIFKALGQGALRAMSKAPMTTAAVGIGGAGAYEATRPTNKLIPQILPNATGAAPPTPPLNEKAGYVIAALAKLAVDQAGGSYLNAQNTINAQRVAQIKADAERVRIASGAPKPSGNGTYSYSGTVFPNRVENAQHSFTPPAAQGQGEFPRQPVQAPSMRGDTTPTFNNPTPPTSNNTFAPRMAKPTNPPPANRWKPIDISGDRRRKEKEMGWAPNSMNQFGEHYGENGPRSAELAKAPASISNTYVAPPGEDPQHTALNKAMFDIKKEQRVALASGKTWSPSGVNIINPVKPTAMAKAPAPKAPSNTYATSRFSSTPPSWATQGGYQKTSGVLQAIGAAGQALGLKGLAKGVSTGIGSFRKPLTTLGNSVPEGILSAERNQALQAGNKFLSSFKPEGFNVYAGRVKTPGSIAGHGTEQATNDLLGFRLSSKQGYGQPAVDMLTKQLTDAGVNINSSKMLVRPGYHGHNIKGDLHGSPVEFQLSPRRLQGLNAADHSMVYKPHESGVNPTIGKMYAPLFQYGMNVASPMVPATTRLGYGAAGVGAVGAVGAGGYAATR